MLHSFIGQVKCKLITIKGNSALSSQTNPPSSALIGLLFGKARKRCVYNPAYPVNPVYPDSDNEYSETLKKESRRQTKPPAGRGIIALIQVDLLPLSSSALPLTALPLTARTATTLEALPHLFALFIHFRLFFFGFGFPGFLLFAR